jgi:hypothetical protein
VGIFAVGFAVREMTNDEARMTKEARNPKFEIISQHSSFILHTFLSLIFSILGPGKSAGRRQIFWGPFFIFFTFLNREST